MQQPDTAEAAVDTRPAKVPASNDLVPAGPGGSDHSSGKDRLDAAVAAVLEAADAMNGDSAAAGIETAVRVIEHLCRSRRLPLKSLLDRVEQQVIMSVLRQTNGSQKEAALLMAVKITTLNSKIQRHGIRIERRVRLCAVADRPAGTSAAAVPRFPAEAFSFLRLEPGSRESPEIDLGIEESESMR